jgi:hypothetical protein
MQILDFSGNLLKGLKMIFLYKSTIYKKIEDRVIKLEIINEPVVCHINSWASVRNPIFGELNRIFLPIFLKSIS